VNQSAVRVVSSTRRSMPRWRASWGGQHMGGEGGEGGGRGRTAQEVRGHGGQ
jgi:hypothetical protein